MTTPPWNPPQRQPRNGKPGCGKIAGIGCAGIAGLFILSAVIAGLSGGSKNTAATSPPSTSAPASHTAASPSPTWTETYAPDSIAAKCRAQHWPQPMPALAGKSFDPLGKALECFDDVHALAPDGHDVMTDSGADQQQWTVASTSPKAGAPVRESSRITVRLRKPGDTGTGAGSSTSGSSGGGTTGGAGSGTSTTSGGTSDHGGATALCVDGTLSYSAHHRGTCSHHHGVAVWYR